MNNINIIDLRSPKQYTGINVISLSSNPNATIEIKTVQPTDGFLPNVAYNLGNITDTTTFTLASGQAGVRNHYYWTFDTTATAPTITWPAGLTWNEGSEPSIEANKHYEILVVNTTATCIIIN